MSFPSFPIEKLNARVLLVAYASLLVLALLLGMGFGVAALAFRPAPASAQEQCYTSKPPSAAYTVTVCITQPAAHDVLSGTTTIGVSVSTTGNAPVLAGLVYSLDGQYLHEDAPGLGALDLNTTQFGNGEHIVQVQARMDDDYVSAPSSLQVVFDNGTPRVAYASTPTESATPELALGPTMMVSTPEMAPTASGSSPTRVAPAVPSQTPTLAPTGVAPSETPPADSSWTQPDVNLFGDGGTTCTGSISGYVFDSNDNPMSGIELDSSDGQAATTDTNGFYEFTNLADGSYTITIVAPNGMTASPSTSVSANIVSCANLQVEDLTLSGAAATATSAPTSTTAPSATATPSGTTTIVATATGTMTATATVTGTLSATSTPSGTRTVTPTPTGTLTHTVTATPTFTATPTGTRTVTATPTLTPAPSTTPSPTPTRTPAPTNTASPTPTPTSSSQTLTPVADAYVNEASKAKNFGTSTSIRLDPSPIMNGYLKFTVTGLNGTVKRAVLRLYSESTSKTGYQVHGVADNTWQENTITYKNAPAMAAPVAGSSGAITAGTWTSVEVTSLITGNGAFSFALTSANDRIVLASRESGAHAPQLVLTTGP